MGSSAATDDFGGNIYQRFWGSGVFLGIKARFARSKVP
jgi:hypothetical protein